MPRQSSDGDVSVLESEGGFSSVAGSQRSADFDELRHDAAAEVKMAGWLRKKPPKSDGVKRTWQKVWVKLLLPSDPSRSCLAYYADASEAEQVGRLELKDCIIEHDQKAKYDGKFLFEIRRIGFKKESLMAKSEEERSGWVDAIEHLILHSDIPSDTDL